MVEEDKFIEIMAVKTGMSHDEVESRIDELTNQINAAVNRGELYKIEGLGTFEKKDGATHFEVDEVLETEINQKYAGMKPVELMGSFKETSADLPGKKVEKTGTLDEPMPKKAVPDRTVDKTEPEVAKTPPAPQTNKTQDGTPQKEKPKKELKPSSQSETGTLSIILVVLAIVITILLIGWLLYSLGVFSGSTALNGSIINNTVLAEIPKELYESGQLAIPI